MNRIGHEQKGRAQAVRVPKETLKYRFVAKLQSIAHETSNSHFTLGNLYKIANDMRLKTASFEDLIDSLNNQGYLLKRGNKIYKLATHA